MSVRYFALILGIIFLLVGVLGFVPGMTTMPETHEHDLAVEGPGHGYLLGLFHVNLLHNLVHLLFGVWGIIAYRTFDASRVYARSVTIIYAVLAIMGVIPGLNTMFGLVPLHGHDVWLHLLIAAAAAYFGWAPAPATHSTATHATDVAP